jgi:hypothetical protein
VVYATLFFKILKMAISVNKVYKTVLLILNKEQRGYMTPEEFNKIGSQVQREIFEKYFEDLNQYARMPQSDIDYGNRLLNLNEKMNIFKRDGNGTYAAGPPQVFSLPTGTHIIGSVTYEDSNRLPVEMQRVDRGEFYNLRMSPLVTPSEQFPIYLLEENKIQVYPNIINTKAAAGTANVAVQHIKVPADINWAYTVGNLGQFIYNSNTPPTVDFELHNSEFTEVVLAILLYAGIVIRDPQIVQAAAGQLQADRANQKQ